MSEARAARLPAWAWPLLALPIVAGVGVWTYRAVASAIQVRLLSSLHTTLASSESALGHWLDAQASLAELMAADPRVLVDVESLLALARRTAGDPAALKAAPAQAHLREILTPVVSRQQNAGYFVLDPGGLIVARIVDERVGERVVLTVADAAARVRDGRPVFLAPTLKQRFSNVPMAFLMVPVRDASGATIATFAFRIHAERMAGILNASRVGETGETYAVDAEGRMLTETRFPEQVARLGLLPPEAGGRTTAALEVRDPGVSLAEGRAAATPQKTWPLTWAVAEVVAGRAGVHADGYRDYRGVSVVGAWRWLPEWGFGLVTEIDRAEAYQTMAVVRRAFGVLGAGLLLVAAAIAFSSRRMYGLQKEVQRAARLGQYTLEDKIGEGGMGGRPTGVFYYAMEYLSGLPLDRVILDDGPQPEPRVVHLLEQVCASLAEAHRIGLVHRDVKPANVMLCERGGLYDVVKVLDFGLVKELGAEDDAGVTAVGNIVGTPHYLSPEGVRGASNVGPPSDVYAVGALAYSLVTGQHVFAGKTGGEIIGHHLSSRSRKKGRRRPCGRRSRHGGADRRGARPARSQLPDPGRGC